MVEGLASPKWFYSKSCSRGREARLRALLVVSLLPVSEINHCFRPGFQPAGGGLQVPNYGSTLLTASLSPVPRDSKQPRDNTKNE